MKILLNFIPLKGGGAVQVGLDFVRQVQADPRGHDWYLVATDGTPFDRIPDNEHLRTVKLVSSNPAARFSFEFLTCRKVVKEVKPDLIYTQFGYNWPAAGSTPNVVGCAYSYIMYPEVDFWQDHPFFQRRMKQLKDIYRQKMLARSDHVVFETEQLAERAVHALRMPSERLHVVPPAASSLVSPGVSHGPTLEVCRTLRSGYRVLLLSGYQPHKNLYLLPRTALALRDTFNVDDIVFVTTLPHQHPGTQHYLRYAQELGVNSMVQNVGSIAYEGCSVLYENIDLVILPSRLESFSNNFAEAWRMRKPLIVSDLEWARNICGPGAAYAEYDDAEDTARAILKIRRSSRFSGELVDAGVKMLEHYSTPRERYVRYVEIMEEHAQRFRQ